MFLDTGEGDLMAYYYNNKTHKYHIQDMCHYNSEVSNMKFDTEQMLLQFAEGDEIICKVCRKKRDEQLNKISNRKE